MQSRLVLASTLLIAVFLTGCSAATSNQGDSRSGVDSSSSDDSSSEGGGGLLEFTPTINVGPLISGNVDGSGQFVSSLDDFLLVEEATAYKYGLDCDRFLWHWWSEDQTTHEVAYANQAALESLSAAAAAGPVWGGSCSPTDVTMSDGGETVKFVLSTDPDARNKLGEMLDGTTDKDAIAANMNCQMVSTEGSNSTISISLDYCATTREDGVLIVAYHQPAGADLEWLAAMVNAYADNDSQVQLFINEKMPVTDGE